jgi:hypothetical protein
VVGLPVVVGLEEVPSVFGVVAAPSDLFDLSDLSALSDLSDADDAPAGVEDFSASMAFLRDSEG